MLSYRGVVHQVNKIFILDEKRKRESVLTLSLSFFIQKFCSYRITLSLIFMLPLFLHTLFLIGQSSAIRQGLSRALAAYSPTYHSILAFLEMKQREEDPFRPLYLLERDARVRERKKPGRKRARKGFTWVKR